MLSEGDTLVFGAKIDNLSTELIKKIESLDVVTAVAQQDHYNLKISAKGDEALNQIIDSIRNEGGNIASITTSNESTLEDVFLAVTGKEMRDEASERAAPVRQGHGPKPKARVR